MAHGDLGNLLAPYGESSRMLTLKTLLFDKKVHFLVLCLTPKYKHDCTVEILDQFWSIFPEIAQTLCEGYTSKCKV